MQPRDRSSPTRPRRCEELVRLTVAGAAVLLLCPGSGRAQPVASSVDPPARPARPSGDEPIVVPAPAPPPEPTAADVAGAPVPGQESGRVDRIDGGDSTPRLIGRGILFLPKVAIQAAFAPVRAGIWANERYRLYDRGYGVFFNEPLTIGLYPTIGHSSGFGFTYGAKFVHRDLFGAHERISLSARTGGRFNHAFEATARSGDRLGKRVRLQLKGEIDRRPKERFYGLGNRDEVMVTPEPIDALNDATAIEARFRQQLMRATLVADFHAASSLHLIASGALTDLALGRSDEGPPIDEVYRLDSLTGWPDARYAYGELEARWDRRRYKPGWEPRSVHSGGWFVGAYAGRAQRVDGGSDFWRYGAHLQQFLRLGRGPRVITARAHAEAVSGRRGDVPFFELPQLGGSKVLRGYDSERFRDRIAVLGSLDYEWELSEMFAARLFTDVGRVYGSWDELEATGLRVGYGVGFDARTRASFLFRTSVASSIDGGVFLNLSFEPVFDVDTRVEKR
jgi:hypothetical protein